jgi:hypothetical protein
VTFFFTRLPLNILKIWVPTWKFLTQITGGGEEEEEERQFGPMTFFLKVVDYQLGPGLSTNWVPYTCNDLDEINKSFNF